MTRSSETILTFSHPFRLAALDAPLPAGRYLVVTEEEEIDGLSFRAYFRTATQLHLPAQGTVSALQQAVTVNPDELAAVHLADTGQH